MKINVELEDQETLEEAEEFMAKALKVKSECSHTEKYADPVMNEAHDLICQRFNELLNNVQTEIRELLNADQSKN
jgi:hypothetical protein